MKITRKAFGVLSCGRKAHLYILKAGGLRLCVSSFGAAWTSLVVPARSGPAGDVLLGFSDLGGYVGDGAYMGITAGRFANRIAGARFSLGGRAFELDANDGAHSLHGGRRGFGKRLWKSQAYEDGGGVYARFELDSPDGDGGFPGRLRVSATYGLTKSARVIAAFEASADAPTPVSITNHAYFNLAGEGSPSVLSHELALSSSSYVETDGEGIPTGRLAPVRGTPFDFRERKPIGRDMAAAGGYDHCFSVDGDIGRLRPCAEAWEPGTGRRMSVQTTQPGVQFYAGGSLCGAPGKAGASYPRHSGFCLETQGFPDAPNREGFPPCVFGPGKGYSEKTVFSFEIE